MPPIRIRLSQIQQAFRKSNALYRGFVGGIGSGKSWVGAYDLVTRSLPNRLYMVTAPTYPMLRDATLRSFLRVSRDLGYLRDYSKTDKIATLVNGAEVLFRSADDPDSLRGPNLSGWWGDEASLYDDEVWTVGIGRLREEGDQGWASATFTPKGKTHWTYKVFGKGGPNVELFRSRTRDNPFLPANFDSTLREQYPGLLAQQELEGMFVDVEGAEWPGSYFSDDIWFDEWPRNCLYKIVTLDPSKGRSDKAGDYSAFVVLGYTADDGQLWVEADLARRPTSQIVADGIELARIHQPYSFGVEANQFQELLCNDFEDQAVKDGILLPLVHITNTTNKVVRIRRIGPYLARKRIRFKADSPGTSLLVSQLMDFPAGDHDDGPDSLEMGLRLMADLLASGEEDESTFERIRT